MAAPGLGRTTRTDRVDYPSESPCFIGHIDLCVVSVGMPDDAAILSDDPAVLKAMIAALQAENARMSATLQALRLRIAKLQKQAFGKSSEKIEREIAQLELALEDLTSWSRSPSRVAGPPKKSGLRRQMLLPPRPSRVAGRASRTRHPVNAASSIPAPAAPIAEVICGW